MRDLSRDIYEYLNLDCVREQLSDIKYFCAYKESTLYVHYQFKSFLVFLDFLRSLADSRETKFPAVKLPARTAGRIAAPHINIADYVANDGSNWRHLIKTSNERNDIAAGT